MNYKVIFKTSGSKPVNLSVYTVILLFWLSPMNVEAQYLPVPESVDRIWIQPHDEKVKDFYTEKSLLKALPYLKKTTFGRSMAFGKVWLWQKGIIYLKNGKKIHWRSFTDNIILIETDYGPVFYTDIQSQTSDFIDSKIIRTIYTWEGPKEIIIDTN